jgi:hypothetical protein
VLASGDLVTRADLLGIPPSGEPGPRPVPIHPELRAPAAPTSAAAEVAALNGRLQTLHRLVCQRGSITSLEYAAVVGISARTALRDLANLQGAGVLAREGSRRGARYRLANPLAD